MQLAGPGDDPTDLGDSHPLLLESGRQTHALHLAMTRRVIACILTAALYLLATLTSFAAALVRSARAPASLTAAASAR